MNSPLTGEELSTDILLLMYHVQFTKLEETM